MNVRSSLIAALVALFGALHAVLVAIPGIWRSWMIVILPIEGVLLGPKAGFLAALLGCLIGRLIRPRPGFYVIFGLAEPVGALVAGLAFKKKWRAVLTLFAVLLAAYFAHPLGRELPAWCLWDIYIALILIPAIPYVIGPALEEKDNPKRLTPAVALAAFIGVEADVLTRIFVLIPMGLYALMGLTAGALYVAWLAGAVETPVESIVSVLVTTTVGVPLLVTLEKSKLLEWPVT